MLKSIVILMLGILFVGCVHLESDTSSSRSNDNFNSTLWMQNSSEFRASSLQTYNIARKNLEVVAKTTTGTAAIEQTGRYRSLPAAVILDIDETVLDNSKYHAELILRADDYSFETWDQWVALKQATAVPGAVNFINYAEKKGVEVIYITNRECKVRKDSIVKCPQKRDTIENLKKIGIPGVKSSHVLLRKEQDSWSSEKSSRRKVVAESYRIVMLFGDDLGDFLPNAKKNITPEERARLVDEHGEKWGSVWFILPNPKYGSWLRVLEKPGSQYLKGYTSRGQL